MKDLVIYICICTVIGHVRSYRYHNETTPDPASLQLVEFRLQHPKPSIHTRVSGEPMDIRDETTLNQDIFINRNHFRFTSHQIRERIPERVFNAKGAGAFGYFEVTHDVSEYIKSDVFNGVGKRTPVAVRFSSSYQNIGGTDLAREPRGMGIKLYTKQGNLDFACWNLPVFVSKDPIVFQRYVHAFKRNPRTDILSDQTARWDLRNMHPSIMHASLRLVSDYGLPDGYRKMDSFAQHVYEIYNEHGKQYYVKFNFRAEMGTHNLSDARAQAIGALDADYFIRDLYNAIAEKRYPSWKVEMNILTEDVMKVDFDPFDITRIWKRGTYKTVTIGRIVLNQRVDNHFKDSDQIAFSPDNLVPGIMGPFDIVFRARKIFYPNAQQYRLGVNHDNIRINRPLYDKNYNRDGHAPVLNNMRDAPNYFPNSFNGPMPYVDDDRRTSNKMVYHRNAVDLQPAADFYNEIHDDEHRNRMAYRLADSLRPVAKDVQNKSLRILTLIDKDLGKRVKQQLSLIRSESVQRRQQQVAQCLTEANQNLAYRSKKYLHESY